MMNYHNFSSNLFFEVIDKNSPFYGQKLEWISTSPLEDWTAKILKTSGKGDTKIFFTHQVKRLVGDND